jgi:hypothetical protein
MEWINVKDQLPVSDRPLLVATGRGRACIGMYRADSQKWYGFEAWERGGYLTGFNHLAGEVTHWQQLPDIPAAPKDETQTYRVKVMKASYGYLILAATSIPDAMEKAQSIIAADAGKIKLSHEETRPVHAEVLKGRRKTQ